MSEHFGLDIKDILTMSWRRFRILYRHLHTTGAITTSEPQHEPRTASSPKRKVQFNPIDDWNNIVGRSAPDRQRTISFDEYANKQGIERKIVG